MVLDLANLRLRLFNFLAASKASLAGLLNILAPPHFAILRDAAKGRVKFDGMWFGWLGFIVIGSVQDDCCV
jgi:hypothetical protein